ncbi:hypothetical protein MLDJOKPK_00054 [Salmonella phage SPAsTU]|nr:hypothetical protein MLDJOKPK_00054 [Salmonella phage SPAsTU]
MAKAPRTTPVRDRRTTIGTNPANKKEADKVNVPQPSALPEDLAANFAARMKQIRVEQDYLIEPGEEVITITPAPWLKFSIHCGAELWSFSIQTHGKVIGVLRSTESRVNIYPLIAVAALRSFLNGEEKEAGHLIRAAGLIGNILPNATMVHPVTTDINFTDGENFGYFLLGAAGNVVVGNLEDPEVRTHLDNFAKMYNSFAHAASRGLYDGNNPPRLTL